MAAKKASRKKTARKKTARKKTTAKKTTRKKAAGKSELPASLSALGRQLRRDLSRIEKQIETAGKGTGKSLTRVLREASHTLGSLEARGQKEWKAISKRARAEVEKTVKRVQRAAKS